jgi:hypothetical protein
VDRLLEYKLGLYISAADEAAGYISRCVQNKPHSPYMKAQLYQKVCENKTHGELPLGRDKSGEPINTTQLMAQSG